MRVLVQALCLSCAAAVMFKVPDADQFCDRGTKRNSGSDWFCCPKACGGQCLADQGKCDEEKKHKSDVYNPACCIPSWKDDAKACASSSAPCQMEKEWTAAEKKTYRDDQFAAATNQETKKFKENNHAVNKQRAMLDGYKTFIESSKPYTKADGNGANPMSGFQNSMDGCNNLFRQKENDAMRADCLSPHYAGANKEHGLHKDHDYTKKRLGSNTFADFYFGFHNQKAANTFAGCVAGKAADKCGSVDDFTGYGKNNEDDCRYCLDWQ